ncbi:MAG: hypothetical protein IT236_02945 [Bacteroidia bacterium]|nr:hypothetical protein [Bacteroidia bacterium]
MGTNTEKENRCCNKIIPFAVTLKNGETKKVQGNGFITSYTDQINIKTEFWNFDTSGSNINSMIGFEKFVELSSPKSQMCYISGYTVE